MHSGILGLGGCAAGLGHGMNAAGVGGMKGQHNHDAAHERVDPGTAEPLIHARLFFYCTPYVFTRVAEIQFVPSQPPSTVRPRP